LPQSRAPLARGPARDACGSRSPSGRVRSMALDDSAVERRRGHRRWRRPPPPSTCRRNGYFLSADFSVAGLSALAAAGFGVGTVGSMMWAYLVPFHITHGPPFQGSVGSASSWAVSGVMTITCGPLTTHWLSAAALVA